MQTMSFSNVSVSVHPLYQTTTLMQDMGMKRCMCGEGVMRRYMGSLDLQFNFSVNPKSL